MLSRQGEVRAAAQTLHADQVPSAGEAVNRQNAPAVAPMSPTSPARLPLPAAELPGTLSPGHARRQARAGQVLALHREGCSIRAIVRTLGVARQTVRRYLAAGGAPPRAVHPAPGSILLEPFLPRLWQRWQEGCRVATTLWQELLTQGFTGSLRTVQRVVRPWRPPASDPSTPATEARVPTPAPRQMAYWLMQTAPGDQSDPTARRFVDTLCAHSEAMARCRELTLAFIALILGQSAGTLEAWIAAARCSGLRELIGFANGVQQDHAAVAAALRLAWSNGQTEAQVTRIKMIKRQMYGRAGFTLLRARVLQPP